LFCMSARSLNLVHLIGNLTRDPELRYTPKGSAVCDFGMATNRYWTTSEGERQEEAEFHNIVAWGKLAELCSQLLRKGRKVYIQGRLHTRTWDDEQGQRHWKTEVVAEEMIILDSNRVEDYATPGEKAPAPVTGEETSPDEGYDVAGDISGDVPL